MAKEQIVWIDDTGSTLTYKEEVVRCRNCRWREDDQCGYFEFKLKNFNNYCSWAKPKEKNAAKAGTWTVEHDPNDRLFMQTKYRCSACGEWNTYGKSKYCPNCGARMDEE